MAGTPQTRPAPKIHHVNQGYILNHAESKLPIPSLVRSNSTLQRLPVIAVPGTYSFGITKKLVPPKTVEFRIPDSLLHQLTAYWIRLGNTHAFYLIAPKGMKGSTLTATDNSFGLTLVGKGYTISLGSTGGSPMIAAAQAQWFFKVPKTELIAPPDEHMYRAMSKHATIIHFSPKRVMFSFLSNHHARVLGEMYYGIVTPDKSDYLNILGSLAVTEIITYPRGQGHLARRVLNHTAPLFKA